MRSNNDDLLKEITNYVRKYLPTVKRKNLSNIDIAIGVNLVLMGYNEAIKEKRHPKKININKD